MKRQTAANGTKAAGYSNGHSQAGSNGFHTAKNGHTSNGYSDENANVLLKARNGAHSDAVSYITASSDERQQAHGRLFYFFARIFVPLFVMIIYAPNIIIVQWYIVARCDGSWLRFFDMFAQEGFIGGITHMWSDIHIASPIAVGIILGYMLWALLLMTVVPGPRVEGPVTSKGNVPIYRDNGFSCFVLTMLAFGVLAFLLPRFTPYSVTIVYDHFGEFLATLIPFSYVLCVFLHVKGLVWPSSSDSGSSGNLIFDYYWGTELYPRVFGIDVKVFTNCRFGMTVWALLVAIFALKSYEIHGFVDSMWVSATLQMIYFTKFFWWESGYMRTIDIMLDRAGFCICWGCLTYIAGFYASVSFYLVSHPVQLGPALAWSILLLGVASCLINYDADRHKLEVRRTNGRCIIWGRQPDVIRAQYRTSDGTLRSSLLLVSGYWGLARHFHYFPELMLALMWTIPAGLDHFMPYSYIIFLFILLVHRTYRDNTKCHEKYGHYWEEYCRRVPYKIIPHVF